MRREVVKGAKRRYAVRTLDNLFSRRAC